MSDSYREVVLRDVPLKYGGEHDGLGSIGDSVVHKIVVREYPSRLRTLIVDRELRRVRTPRLALSAYYHAPRDFCYMRYHGLVDDDADAMLSRVCFPMSGNIINTDQVCFGSAYPHIDPFETFWNSSFDQIYEKPDTEYLLAPKTRVKGGWKLPGTRRRFLTLRETLAVSSHAVYWCGPVEPVS